MKKFGKRSAWNWSRYFPLYALLGPTFILLLIFNYYPALLAMFRSFFEWDLGNKAQFVGLGNFVRMFQDPIFYKSLVNISKLLIFTLAVNLTVPLLVAELIFSIKSLTWSYLVRVLLVIPMLVPPVVVWVLWKFIYSDAGIMTSVLEFIGKPDWIYGWLSHPKTALFAVAFVGFPFAYGFNVLIYYAGLSNIPESMLESARIDGVSPWQMFFRIHLPMILTQLRLLLIVTIIAVLQGFESVYVLTGDGGPGYETMLPGLYMFYNGFTYNRMGYACAIGLFLFLLMLTFTFLNNKYIRSEQEFQA
ncbi:MAG: carbohydrate ABC transporter permease [Candidatus Zhuqueibacterota bacterium]